MNELPKQLAALKTNPKAGWVSDDVRTRSRARLMEAIGAGEEQQKVFGSSFFKFTFVDLVSTRIAAGAAVFVLILGGWTTVNAASASLPGDTLYNVKRATEAAQLKFASTESKALLHSEFAQRRVEEVVALKESSDPVKVDRVGETIEAFNKEIEAAQTELRKLKDQGRAETVAVASQLDKSIDELENVIDQADADVAADPATIDVRDTAQEASDTVVDVVVETHEEEATELSARELEAMFQAEMREVTDRQAFDLGRLIVIQASVAADPELLEVAHLPTGLDVMEFSLTSATDRLGEARSFIAAGGYRAAFDIMREIRAQLLTLETQLAEAEIAIINGTAELAAQRAAEAEALNAVEEPAEETAVEDTLPSSTIEE